MTAAAAVAAHDKAETRRAIDAVDLADLVRRDGVHLQRVGRLLQGCCPLPNHDDRTASFTVYPQGDGWCCFGCNEGGDAARYIMLTRGCSFPTALAYLGIGDGQRAPLAPLAPRPANARRKASSAPPTRPADVVYSYQDAGGVVRYQVLRWNLTPAEQPCYNGAAKLIRHAGPDGRPGMPAGVAPLLYRLPAVLAADPALPVFVCEGEKDADRLAAAGLVSTCNSGGAGHWPAGGSQHLAGRQVVILPDNDEAGRRHAALVADELRPVAAAVTVLALPGLPDHGDVSDFLAVHTVDALQVLAAFAPTLPPATVAGDVDPATGELVITGADQETSLATADLIATLQTRAEQAEQARDEAQAELDRILAVLRNKQQTPADRVLTLAFQRAAQRRKLAPGETGELPVWDVAQEGAVSPDTASRFYAKLEQQQIITHKTRPVSGPDGVRSVSLVNYSPALYEVTALVTPKSKEGNTHGGYRPPACPHCGADGAQQVAKRYCKSCKTHYIPLPGDRIASDAPAPMPQDAAQEPITASTNQETPAATPPASMPQLAAHDLYIGGNLRHKAPPSSPSNDTPASLIGTESAAAWSHARAVADTAALAPPCEVCGPLIVCTCLGQALPPVIHPTTPERTLTPCAA